MEGSPAQRSGVILPGDVLDSIAGIKVANMSQEDMASLITGPEGSKVRKARESWLPPHRSAGS